MNVVLVNDLKKIYPPTRSWFRKIKTSMYHAVKGISFVIKEAENVGLLGPNGAGKTTTIEMLLGTLTPTSGTISFFNKDFTKHRSEILQKVGFASTYAKLPASLTISENLHFYGKLFGLSHAVRIERIKKYLNHFDMWHLRNKETGLLSAGETTRVMLAKAFFTHPKIVLLDEPTAALDPDIAKEVRSFVIDQQEKHGVSFLFTSHNMMEVTEVCDRVLVLQKGKIIADNTPEELAATVSKSHVRLMVGDGLKRTIAHAQKENIAYQVQGRLIELSIDEVRIAQLLHNLARIGVEYTSISIKNPSLEDYFLQISKQAKERDAS